MDKLNKNYSIYINPIPVETIINDEKVNEMTSQLVYHHNSSSLLNFDNPLETEQASIDNSLKLKLKNSNKLIHSKIQNSSQNLIRQSSNIEPIKVDIFNKIDFNNKVISTLQNKKVTGSFNKAEIKLIMNYIDLLPNFISSVKDKNEEFYQQTLLNISTNLEYFFAEKNKVLFRFGEFGDTFYIIVKGECAVAVPKSEVLQLTENEYVEYLLTLRINDEIELLNKTLEAIQILLKVE